MAKKNRIQISQEALATIIRKQIQLEKLKEELRIAEEIVFERLKSGCKVKPGILTARVSTWTRRNVAWKEVVVREIGQDYADRVLAGTKPDEYEKLVVETAA